MIEYSLIFSASKGIGYGCAEEFVKNGMNVIITSSNCENINYAADCLRKINSNVDVVVSSFDISNESQLIKFLDDISDKNVKNVVLNTPGPKPSKIIDTSIENFDEAYKLIVRPKLIICNYLISNNENKIFNFINIESSTVKQQVEGLVLSNTLRGATNNYMKSIAQELGPLGYRANTILVASIYSDRVRQLALNTMEEKNISIEEYLLSISKNLPLKRLGTINEVGNVAYFLASPSSSYLNGISIPVDGGLLASII
jgi:3-oxoacyl-[acyl-carrier protein] reductase